MIVIEKKWVVSWCAEALNIYHHCIPDEQCDVISGETLSKAKYDYFLRCDSEEVFFSFIKGLKSKRLHCRDLIQLEPCAMSANLTNYQRENIKHCFSNGRFYGERNGNDLNHLVTVGLFTKPSAGFEPSMGYYKLTNLGEVLAQSMIPIERGGYDDFLAKRKELGV